MARLIDDLMIETPERPTTDPEWMSGRAWRQMHERVRTLLDDAPLFVVDNVSEYFYAGTNQEHWEIARDFPNLAPPFPTFWVESRRPSAIESETYGTIPSRALPRCWGALFIGNEVDDGGAGRWELSATLYTQTQDRRITGPPGSFVLRIAGDGSLAVVRPQWWLPAGAPSDLPDLAYRGRSVLLYPLLLAISFLHCRNVTVETTEPPARLARARARRYGEPLRAYHTLDIHPMREVLRREGQSETQGLQRALHICRGHFKTFTEDRPLFGKHTGTYWWNAQVRGTGSQATAKTYKVHPPDND